MNATRRTRFFAYFREQLGLVDHLGGREYKVHKKLIYVALLDTMAGLVYPRLSNRRRFVQLVKDFGDWSECEHISTPHLARMLELNPAPQFNEVRKMAIAHLGSWSEGDLKTARDDLKYNSVRSKWPKDKDSCEPVEGVALEAVQHAHLLYSFRNAVVHSFRPLGTDFEMPEDTEPYYLSVRELIMVPMDAAFTGILSIPPSSSKALPRRCSETLSIILKRTKSTRSKC